MHRPRPPEQSKNCEALGVRPSPEDVEEANFEALRFWRAFKAACIAFKQPISQAEITSFSMPTNAGSLSNSGILKSCGGICRGPPGRLRFTAASLSGSQTAIQPLTTGGHCSPNRKGCRGGKSRLDRSVTLNVRNAEFVTSVGAERIVRISCTAICLAREVSSPLCT